MAAVLAFARAAEPGLVVHRAALRVLAEVIGLGVTTKRTLLRRGAVVLAVDTLLGAILLPVVVVGVSFLLIRGVVVGVVAGGGAEGARRLLGRRLGGLGSVGVEGSLRDGGTLLGKRVDRLLGRRCSLLGNTMSESAILLSAGNRSLGN